MKKTAAFAIFLLLLTTSIQAESYIEFSLFDRTRFDGAQTEIRINLEIPPPKLPSFRFVIFQSIRSAADKSEQGHFQPISFVGGGGALWRYNAWELSLLGFSFHCFASDETVTGVKPCTLPESVMGDAWNEFRVRYRW